jgi:hypothetical protein
MAQRRYYQRHNAGGVKNTLPHSIKFDVMLGGRWICTLTMALGLEYLIGYEGEKPVFDIPMTAFYEYVEQKRPSLKDKKYHIELVTKKTSELWIR